MTTTLANHTNKAMSTMFKVFFAILISLLSLNLAFALKNEETIVQSECGGKLEKAFTATCAMEANINYELNCTYSVIFATAFPTGYSANATIIINNVPKTYSIIVPSNATDYGVNFKVRKGDEILITFVPDAPVSTTLYAYRVYDAANAEGYSSSTTPRNGAIIARSRSRDFQVINPCTGSCTYQIQTTNLPTLWMQSGVSIVVFVNGVQQGSFDGQSNYNYNVLKGDVITYQINSTNPNVEPGLNAATTDFNTIAKILDWYSNLYFTPMIVTNNCTTTPLPPSPFGGVLVPVPPEALKKFLKANSASLSTLWYPIALNPEQRRRRGGRRESIAY